MTTAAGAGLGARDSARPIAIWLFACAGMVFAMAVIGAITRLTESGLSIAEWKPLIGALPPLSEAEWNRVFDLYRKTPEFIHKNAWMGLDDFKPIFFWEWLHRLWGRLIGVVFVVPLAWFLLRGRISPELRPKLLALFALGALQGAVGWWMVASGLVDRPAVSHYRLAVHLSLAIFLYAALIWVGLSVLRPQAGGALPGLRGHAWAATALAATTVVWGAFVAGLDAGFAYNAFPAMLGDGFSVTGSWAPAELWSRTPLWVNVFENHATVQFAHRWLALATMTVVLALVWRARRAGASGAARTLAVGLGHMVLLQVALGIATLLLVVPISLAAAHQAGALVLIGLLTALLFEMRRLPPSPAR